jgi:hypothetical protein
MSDWHASGEATDNPEPLSFLAITTLCVSSTRKPMSLSWILSLFSVRSRGLAQARRLGRRPQVEVLEDRCVPTVYVGNMTVAHAVYAPGVPSLNVTIQPVHQDRGGAVIDGNSQPGFKNQPSIDWNGSLSGHRHAREHLATPIDIQSGYVVHR